MPIIDEKWIRTDERKQVAAEIEAFADAYVKKWSEIATDDDGRDSACAQGWAILQAAKHITASAGAPRDD